MLKRSSIVTEPTELQRYHRDLERLAARALWTQPPPPTEPRSRAVPPGAHVAFYAGWPGAVNASRVGIEVFGPK